LEEAADAAGRFTRRIIDVVAPLVPAVKPQIAFFESLGPAGVRVFEEVIRYAADAGLLVIADGKRNDIGSTAEAYAAAFLGSVELGGKTFRPFPADALTVNAYLGSDGIVPFVEAARSMGTGLFVLLKTSNPSGGEIQDLETGGRRVFEALAERIAAWGEDLLGTSGFSSVGAVVAATYPDLAAGLRKLLPRTPFLVPGFGAQGGRADNLAPLFDENGLGAVVNSSRGIIFAFERDPWQERFGLAQWEKAVEAATQEAAGVLARTAGLA
jgi:orotidine-5'-phosphate decarboxylase